MNVAFFGGLDRRPFPPGWMKETVVSIFGGSDVDLSSTPPGPDARLTAVAVLGGVKILVPLGTRVSVSGLALFGGREVKVSQSGDGPEVKMSLWAFLGGVVVEELTPTIAT
jgi:predicted membrane protein